VSYWFVSSFFQPFIEKESDTSDEEAKFFMASEDNIFLSFTEKHWDGWLFCKPRKNYSKSYRSILCL